MTKCGKHYGFTLVELSVVLVVIAIITGMGVSAGIDSLESTRRVSTNSKLDVIEDALFTFREKYGRLPCPAAASLPVSDANYGVEAANPGSCTGGSPAATHITTGDAEVPSGAVPVKALSLPNEFMYDGWGRKFHYEVTPAMTVTGAFAFSQPSDDCALTVVNHSGGNMEQLAVYALVSYGKNGVGAYLKSGGQFTNLTAGTAEQTNIRTTTDSPTIRVKNSMSGSMGTAGYYDDIVRFKSRYQMMDDNDRSIPLYSGPELVLSYPVTSGIQMVYGKKKCGAYDAYTGTVPAVVGAAPQFMAFTPENSHLFVYHTNNCKLYMNDGTTLTAVTDATPVPNCPAAATVGAMAQGNGILVLNTTSAPYARVYELIGTGMDATYVELPGAFVPALTDVPDNITLSQNGEYLAVSKNEDYARLYVRKGNHYHDLGTLPGDSYTEYGNAISPDGKYYAVVANGGGDGRVYLWRNDNGVFSQITDGGDALLYTATGYDSAGYIAFSPTSDYLAFTTITDVSTYVLHVNQATDVVSQVLELNDGGALSSDPPVVAFAKDSSFIAISQPKTEDLLLYRKNSSTSFTQVTPSSGFTFGTVPNFITTSH